MVIVIDKLLCMEHNILKCFILFLQNLKDPLNFGFYMPPFKGRAGKFLDEERPLRDYPMDKTEPNLEVR